MRSLLTRAGDGGHLLERNDEEDYQHHDAECHVRVADYGEVVEANAGLFAFGERAEDNFTCFVAAVGPQRGQHDERGDGHARKRAYGIECLCKIEAARGGFFAAERKDKGVGGRFEESKAEGEDIEREAEEREVLILGSRNEEERPRGVKSEPQQYAALVVVTPDEKGGGYGHGGVAAVEGKLYHRGLGGRKFHDGLERSHHRVGDVVGKAPKGKERGDDDECGEVLFLDKFLFHERYALR